MTRLILSLLLLPILALPALAGDSDAPLTGTWLFKNDVLELRATFTAEGRVDFRHRDAEETNVGKGRYTFDGVERVEATSKTIEAHGGTLLTVDAVVRALTSLPSDMQMATRHSNTRIKLVGERLATTATNYDTRVRMGSGETFAFRGIMTMLVERSDGGWRVVTAHASTERARRGR